MKKLFLLLLMPLLSQAQLSQNLSKYFKAHIILKIDEVNSKVNLSEDQQFKIGQKLLIADSLANINLTKNLNLINLRSYYTIDTDFLKPILSPEELDRYGYALNKDNRYLVALQFAMELNLAPSQIIAIRKQNDSLSAIEQLPLKETIQLYNKRLNSILAKEQYVSLIKIIYQEQSTEDAKKDWVKIKQYKLVEDKNDKTEFTKIFNYYLSRNSFLDKKAELYDKKKGDFFGKKIALNEPSVLTHVNILSDGTYKNNKYASVIKYAKIMELDKKQIDSLLFKYKQYELIRFENSETTAIPKMVPSEYSDITQILTPEQVDKWLMNKNISEARKEAIRNWAQLEAEGLIKDLDKKDTVNQFSNYHLKVLVSKEIAKMYHTPENIFRSRDIEKKKPELLQKLDDINSSRLKKNKIKNSLTW
ncbi:hypothetical protein [Flavobacterium foetidum]|uniref:hypothetical protein n=1 Tax=Flavobacterium foetidum TaxID=2026681 RepID=UPI001074CE3A|nr:hypothetical protein [Flavobacterium foetidum]KAF2517206.1 hypothetical protein E0W73_03660 [Flavobacterium foetidum]